MSYRYFILTLGILTATGASGQPASIVRDIWPGSQGSFPSHDLSRRPSSLAGLEGRLLFLAQDGGGGIDLWETDGSFTGTRKVKDFGDSCLGTSRAGTLCFPLDLVESGGKVFFVNTDANGAELWVTDGTAGGTKMVKDINPAGDSLFVGGDTTNYWNSLTDVNGVLFFAPLPLSVWTSDGTAGGTVKVEDLPPSGCGPDLADSFANRDGELVFVRTCDVKELWGSDGTADGTRIVKTFSGAISGPIVVVNGLAFFVANDGQGGELWLYDGASAKLVKDIVPGPGSPVIQTESLRAVDGSLYFYDGDRNLWKSDGTPGGTRLVQQIVGASKLTVVAGILYFTAKDGVHGEELWALNVAEACDTDVIVDNGSPGTSFTGQWRASGSPLFFGTSSLWERVNSRFAPTYRFQADLPAGDYEVLEWHSSLSSRTRSARHVISHGGGTTAVFVDQSVNPGRWNSLGTYAFSGPGAVAIRAEDSQRSTNADAIRFVCRTLSDP